VPSILVADDNTNIQKMVSLAFEDRGITVVAVGNGEAAVRRIPDMNPDLVLADIFMPVRNGYEVCEFVKKDQRFSHVPVILLVGAFDPLDEKEARRVGADGVLKKPFVPPDPLIAMVISALEKNPRVVAELAKAKASLEPHAMPDAGPSFEVQAAPKPEPKPLPDFPEPTPEEAALVYGFGKGVRAIDDIDPAAMAKEPPAPVAHNDKEEDDEDAETEATAHDWRRTAMDFEIPAEDANRPAFSTDELEPAEFFPSETGSHKTEPKFEASIPAPRETAPVVMPGVTPVVAPVVAQEVDMRALEPVEAEPVVERAPIGFSAREPEPAVAPPVSIESRVIEAPPVPAHEPQHENEAKPSLASRMRHWMDGLVSSHPHEETHAAPPDGRDWMETLAEPQASEAAAVEQAPVARPSVVAPEPPPAMTSEPANATAAEESFFAEESGTGEPEVAESSRVEVAPTGMAWGEKASSEISAIDEYQIEEAPAVAEAAHVPETAEPVSEIRVEPIEPHAVEAHTSRDSARVAPEPAPEIWDRIEDTTPSLRDPNLVVPEAVHVKPEPLLVEEEAEAGSHYGEEQQEVTAAHTFEVAASPEPAAEDLPEEESSLHERSFEPAAAESAVEYAEERIPTGPPSREALAEIPFLNPPQGFNPNAPAAPAAAAVDASTVDAVVQKLLEKLQPQLHDLLSQGVLKPLVENLLQQEIEKKDK
jgi:CheY-like chemotaxis protein